MDKGSGMSFANLIILKGNLRLNQDKQYFQERHKSQGQAAGIQVFF